MVEGIVIILAAITAIIGVISLILCFIEIKKPQFCNCFNCKFFEVSDIISLDKKILYKCTKRKFCTLHKLNDTINTVNCKQFEI